MRPDLDAVLHAQLGRTLDRTDYVKFVGRGELGRYDGKVRDCYLDPDHGERIIVVTDRLSAFDVVIGTIPFKGQVLNQIAQYWFAATASIAPNHVISSPDPNVMIAHECRPLPVEFVYRGYLTGSTSTSIWTAYARGERVYCGHRLPDGLHKHERLPEPLLTPTTKAPSGQHDALVSRQEIVAAGTLSEELYDACEKLCRALFDAGQRWAESRGLAFTTYTNLSARAEVYDLLAGEVEKVNASLPPAQRISRFLLLYKELDADDGELTRTRKVRRGVIDQRYRKLIDALYSGRSEVEVETEVTFEDGRTGMIRAEMVIRDLAAAAPPEQQAAE